MNKSGMEKQINTVKSALSPFNVEIRRCAGGVKMIVVGAVGISEFDDNTIAIKCHGTKMQISGEKIKMNALENKTLEIYGRVGEIKLGYGKN